MKIYLALSSVRLGSRDVAEEWIFGAANEVYAFKDGTLSIRYYHDEFDDEVELVEYQGKLLAAAATSKEESSPSRIMLQGLDDDAVPAGAEVVARYLYYKALCGGLYLGRIYDEEEKRFLASYDPETGKEQRRLYDEIYVACADGELYARGDTISKYDSDLQLIWRFTHSKERYARGTAVPFLFGDLVIASIGVERDSLPRKDGEIVALAKEDGHLVWSQVFAGMVDNCLVIGDKVYVAHGQEMVVLDAATGERLLTADSGLECGNLESTLWTDGQYLYFFSVHSNRFRLFTLDGKTVVQDVVMPEEFRLDRMDDATRWPMVRDGKVYFPVRAGHMALNTALYGLFEMTPGEGGMHPTIEIEQGPPVAVEKVKDGKAEYYVLTVSHDRLDDVVRFGELAVKRTAGLHGWQIWKSEARNRKFDGRIVLKVDGAKLDRAKAASMLDKMVKRVHGWAETMTVRAGTRKNPIAFRWEWL